MALTDKLSAIGVAIRKKTGKTDLLTLDAMPAEILAITTGGGGGSGEGIPEEGLKVSGNCQYRFANDGWNWFVEGFGDGVTTEDINTVSYMFYNSKELTKIPFEINVKPDNGATSLQQMFASCSKLEALPKINGCTPQSMERFCDGCNYLRNLQDDIGEWFEWGFIDGTTSTSTGSRANTFRYCYSLRSIPMEFLNHGGAKLKQNYSYFYGGFQDCYALDELVGLPIPYTSASWTSNAFGNTFSNCSRLKEVTFATQEDGSPIPVAWSNQTIDLSNVGFTLDANKITGYNSGITADKQVSDDASYAALKDDPDWFAYGANWSRYNYDSAVNTINSLPDASSGSGNTIKFRMVAGDGDTGSIGKAISNLTEEEIAVAAAKGWTVSLV